MAGPNKRAKKPAEVNSDQEQSGSEDSDSYQGPQEIQATFEGRNPEGQDFHGIKQLLHQLFLTYHVDLSQMSDLLISQNGIGSVLKQSCNDSDDEEDVDMVEETDVFGITSVLNLTSHRETPCVQQLYQIIEEETVKNADPDTSSKIKHLLATCDRLGFIINERFVNIPSKISTLMLSSLHDEITRMGKRDSSYNFEYFLMLIKMWKPKGESGSDATFSNDEEELFFKKADYSFVFNVSSKTDTALTGKWHSEDKELTPYRAVILFKGDKLEGILNEVASFVQT